MRKLELYVKKYGADAGQKLYHTLQSQAAHASVSARLRRKLNVLNGQRKSSAQQDDSMPLFAEAGIRLHDPEPQDGELAAEGVSFGDEFQ